MSFSICSVSDSVYTAGGAGGSTGSGGLTGSVGVTTAGPAVPIPLATAPVSSRSSVGAVLVGAAVAVASVVVVSVDVSVSLAAAVELSVLLLVELSVAFASAVAFAVVSSVVLVEAVELALASLSVSFLLGSVGATGTANAGFSSASTITLMVSCTVALLPLSVPTIALMTSG